MSSEFGTGKTVFVLAIVVGCFAVLWPKIFYPMLTASVKPTSPSRQVSVGWEEENSYFLSQLCFLVEQQQELSTPVVDFDCVQVVDSLCQVQISESVIDDYRQEKDSTNLTECLQGRFSLSRAVVAAAAPPRVRAKTYESKHVRPERPAHLYPEMMHPALREKGRALPQRTIEKQARPGPMPGVRPPMGGAGGMIPPSQGNKGSGAMGVIMPLYTVGIIIFFVYTIMKVLFKKGNEDTAPKLKDFHLDPEYRKYVFAEEYMDKSNASFRQQVRRRERDDSRGARKRFNEPDTKIEDEQMTQLRRRLEETEKAMERLMDQMGTVTDKLTAAKITEVLTQAQAQAKILKDQVSQVNDVTSDDDLTTSDVLTTTMSDEDLSFSLALERELRELQVVRGFRGPLILPQISASGGGLRDVVMKGTEVVEAAMQEAKQEMAQVRTGGGRVEGDEREDKEEEREGGAVGKCEAVATAPQTQEPISPEGIAGAEQEVVGSKESAQAPPGSAQPVEAALPSPPAGPPPQRPTFADLGGDDDDGIAQMGSNPLVDVRGGRESDDSSVATETGADVSEILSFAEDKPCESPDPEAASPIEEDIPEVAFPKVAMVVPEVTCPQVSMPEVSYPGAEDRELPEVIYVRVERSQLPEEPHVPEASYPKVEEPQIPEVSYRRVEEAQVPEASYPKVEEPEVPEVSYPRVEEPQVPEASYPKVEEPQIPEVSYRRVEEPQVPEASYPKVEEPEAPEVSYPRVAEPQVPEVLHPKPEESQVPEVSYRRVEEPQVPEASYPRVEEVQVPEVSYRRVEELQVSDASYPRVEEVQVPEVSYRRVEVPHIPQDSHPKVEEPQGPETSYPKDVGALGSSYQTTEEETKIPEARYQRVEDRPVAPSHPEDEDPWYPKIESDKEFEAFYGRPCEFQVPRALYQRVEASYVPETTYSRVETHPFDTYYAARGLTQGIQLTSAHVIGDPFVPQIPTLSQVSEAPAPYARPQMAFEPQTADRGQRIGETPMFTSPIMAAHKVDEDNRPSAAKQYADSSSMTTGEEFEDRSDSSDEGLCARSTQTSLAFDLPKAKPHNAGKLVEMGTQTEDEQGFSVLGMSTTWSVDKEGTVSSGSSKPVETPEAKINEIVLKALLPSETQLLVTKSQIGSRPVEDVEIDVSEYGEVPSIVHGQVSLAFVGMEQQGDDVCTTPVVCPATPVCPTTPPPSSSGTQTPTNFDTATTASDDSSHYKSAEASPVVHTSYAPEPQSPASEKRTQIITMQLQDVPVEAKHSETTPKKHEPETTRPPRDTVEVLQGKSSLRDDHDDTKGQGTAPPSTTKGDDSRPVGLFSIAPQEETTLPSATVDPYMDDDHSEAEILQIPEMPVETVDPLDNMFVASVQVQYTSSPLISPVVTPEFEMVPREFPGLGGVSGVECREDREGGQGSGIGRTQELVVGDVDMMALAEAAQDIPPPPPEDQPGSAGVQEERNVRAAWARLEEPQSVPRAAGHKNGGVFATAASGVPLELHLSEEDAKTSREGSSPDMDDYEVINKEDDDPKLTKKELATSGEEEATQGKREVEEAPRSGLLPPCDADESLQETRQENTSAAAATTTTGTGHEEDGSHDIDHDEEEETNVQEGQGSEEEATPLQNAASSAGSEVQEIPLTERSPGVSGSKEDEEEEEEEDPVTTQATTAAATAAAAAAASAATVSQVAEDTEEDENEEGSTKRPSRSTDDGVEEEEEEEEG